jgi:hypothetical protein
MLACVPATILLASCRPVLPDRPPPPRLPLISMIEAYPAGTTPADFWADKQRFFHDYETRLRAGRVGPEEQNAMRHLYEIETLRRAGEAQIREYNRLARETNQANGYERQIPASREN